MYADWVTKIANSLETRVPDGQINVASGVSPSGPIHMGNLREVMTGHFVADELRRRGRDVRHILSWDDFDRFRKVPENIEGVDSTWENYIGMSLIEVPAPSGSEFLNWAEHFKNDFVLALRELHVDVVYISQTEMYEFGTYDYPIANAMAFREKIAELLNTQKTLGVAIVPEDFYPFVPYCAYCHKDTTRVTSYKELQYLISYTCDCGFSTVDEPISTVSGKLAWKIDWPMRWTFESIDFEPAGRDHMSPGSSWTVGEEMVKIFGGERPMGQAYSFVGIDGNAKMSSSKGTGVTPLEILSILPPEVVRWLYVRSRPEQSFNIDMSNVSRLMDEWVTLTRRNISGKASDQESVVYSRATSVNFGSVSETVGIIPDVKFSAWCSFADLTLGTLDEMLSLAKESTPSYDGISTHDAVHAINWVDRYMPDSERTIVQGSHDSTFFNSLSVEQRSTVTLLAEKLDEYFDGDLTSWCFGAAKEYMGLEIQERKLDAEQKAFQAEYFKNVYMLLINAEGGPRLPALIRVIGIERTRNLLTGN